MFFNFFNAKLLILSLFILSVFTTLKAQSVSNEFSLGEAIEYGLKNQAAIKKTDLETIKTKHRINEAISGYLPQLKGNVGFTDNLILPTSILPGAIFGQPGNDVAVQFGTQYNLNTTFDAVQLIYDQSLLTALKSFKEAEVITSLSKEKAEEQAAYDIASAYYGAKISIIQKGIIEANIQKLDSLMLIVKSQIDNGFAKPVDYNRLLVTRTNLMTDIQNIEQGYNMQLTVLKYFMSYPLDSTIMLSTDIVKDISNDSALLADNNISSIDIKLLQSQRRLTQMNINQINAGYFPTLSFNFRYGYQAQQNKINFFNKDANWFAFSSIGLNLNVPIFDGLNKKNKVDQLKIQLKQSQLDEDMLNDALKMQLKNAKNKVDINRAAVEQQLNNIKIAEEVYKVTSSQYQSGFAPMTDILNAETAIRESQTNYLKALAQVKLSELEVLKISGNINSIKN
jgi:outer membrane protein